MKLPSCVNVLAGGLLISCLSYGGQPSRRIYLAPDDHTDYMWSGNEEDYRQAFVEMIDYYLDAAGRTSNNPPEQQSRWNCDGTFWLWTYEHNKPAADFEKLMARVRDGYIGAPLNALVSTYGGTPTEAVLRGMYYAGSLERRFKVRFPLAIAMENQTLPYGLGSLWAGAGARQSWKGICGCLTKLNPTGRRPHEIYWWKGADGSRVLMKWNSMLEAGNQSVGGYAEARDPGKALDVVDSKAFQAAYPYPVVGMFGKGWDDLKTLSDEFVTTAREKSTPERQVVVSNINDFFADFEKNYGASLPEYSASFGNEWDLYTASVAEVSARVRRAVEKLRSAEALSTLVSLQWPEFPGGREAARDQAWMNLGIFWEHNWTADGSHISRTERADWGRRVAAQIEAYVDKLHGDAAFALGGMIAKGGSNPSNPRFYVFNPLGWTRTDAADIPYDGTTEIHVVDLSTGRETPFQIVFSPGENRQGRRPFLRIEARDLPAAGYKVFEIRKGKGEEFPPAATVSGNVVENLVYRLKVEDRGAISSLIDKAQANREFARRGDGRAINDLGADSGNLQVESAGPVSVTLKAQADGPLRHTSRITLYRDSRRIDIRNDINENFDGTHTWNFAFDLKAPDVRHEEVGAVIRAKLLADGGNYSPTMSRLEWLTLNHFADMSGSDGPGVTLSNSDCAFMKLGDSFIGEGVSHLDIKTPQIQVLAGGQIDAPQAGIPKQGGDSHFLQRFALQTHRGFDAAASMKFALEHQNPPVTGWVRGGSGYPEATYSLLKISNPDVVLWTLKPAEDGPAKGIVARLWNLSPGSQSYSLSVAPGLTTAIRTTHIETDLEPVVLVAGAVSSSLAGSQMHTLRLVPQSGARK